MNGKHPGITVAVAAIVLLCAIALASGARIPTSTKPQEPQMPSAGITFPAGTATPPELCGTCHQAIYREFAEGFGSDLNYKRIIYGSAPGTMLTVPAKVSSTTLHAAAGREPFPIHAREAEEEGRSCNVCHFPQAFELPDLQQAEIIKPQPRPRTEEASGLTCASCHLTPDGKIRGPYTVDAPHATVADPRMQTAAICAYCHALGKRVIGKQTQTFLEWREDFAGLGLGRQQCQDCHMPRTTRKTAEPFDVPIRAVARHLWTGGHSTQRLRTALNLVIVQAEAGRPRFELHVINIGAGHSVPTGSNRRAVYLTAQISNGGGTVVATRDWMFAPSYGDRPDDRAFLTADKARPDGIAATQADAQGPHESTIRAGEERVLAWAPTLRGGTYTVRGRLVYDLNRYNDRRLTADQTELYRATLSATVK
jgi:hypothetical protein